MTYTIADTQPKHNTNMRSQDEAADDAAYFAARMIDSLQTADAPEDLIDEAEDVQVQVSELRDMIIDEA